MKDPKLGISDKYITFFFSISKQKTHKNKQIAHHQRSENDEICLETYSLERTELNTIFIRQDTTKLSLS